MVDLLHFVGVIALTRGFYQGCVDQGREWLDLGLIAPAFSCLWGAEFAFRPMLVCQNVAMNAITSHSAIE